MIFILNIKQIIKTIYINQHDSIDRLQEAGVLNLWFEPVYEQPTKEEKLTGYLKFREFKFEEKDIENIIKIATNETK